MLRHCLNQICIFLFYCYTAKHWHNIAGMRPNRQMVIIIAKGCGVEFYYVYPWSVHGLSQPHQQHQTSVELYTPLGTYPSSPLTSASVM